MWWKYGKDLPVVGIRIQSQCHNKESTMFLMGFNLPFYYQNIRLKVAVCQNVNMTGWLAFFHSYILNKWNIIYLKFQRKQY